MISTPRHWKSLSPARLCKRHVTWPACFSASVRFGVLRLGSGTGGRQDIHTVRWRTAENRRHGHWRPRLSVYSRRIQTPVILGSRSSLQPLTAGTELPCLPGSTLVRFVDPISWQRTGPLHDAAAEPGGPNSNKDVEVLHAPRRASGRLVRPTRVLWARILGIAGQRPNGGKAPGDSARATKPRDCFGAREPRYRAGDARGPADRSGSRRPNHRRLSEDCSGDWRGPG